VRQRQIRRICENRIKIMAAAKSGVDGSKRKMLRPDKYPDLTKELLKWCGKMQDKFRNVKQFNMVLSGAVVKVQAIKIAWKMGIDMSEFNA